jgi:hypothetical protein
MQPEINRKLLPHIGNTNHVSCCVQAVDTKDRAAICGRKPTAATLEYVPVMLCQHYAVQTAHALLFHHCR